MEKRTAPHPASAFLLSTPDLIRTRLFQLRADESGWSEVLAVSAAISSKRREIEDGEERHQDSTATGAETKNNDRKDSLETLRRELDDWTWPARLVDNPKLAWDRLSKHRDEKESLLNDPDRQGG